MSHPSLLPMEWQPPSGVRAAFTTRAGGVSLAPWDTLNLASHVDDAPENVAANRVRLRDWLRLPAEPAWLSQVHGVDVHHLDAAPAAMPEAAPVPAADAAIASLPGRVCVVMVADCLPVLFASRDGRQVAAAHAGWRGLAAGVLERTVAEMGVLGPDLCAWIGPSISAPNFEVGDDVRAAFVAQDAGAAMFFTANARGRWQADLTGIARRRLSVMGVAQVSGGHWCTFADRQRFFSHRRDGRGGRMAALIWRTG